MRISDWSSDVCSSDLLTGHRGCVKLWRWSNAKGGGDDRRDDNPGRPERGRLSGGRSFSQRVRRTGRVCSERDFRGPGTWRDGEAVVVRQLLGPRERSEEHTSELQSLMRISYAVFCLKKKNIRHTSETSHGQSKKS